MARPVKHDIEEIVDKFNQYIDHTDYPIIKEFCALNDISYGYLEELKLKHTILSESIKKALTKAESYLETNALRNKVNPVFAMFRLKQPCFGWKDKQEIEQKTDATIHIELDKDLGNWAK